MTSDAPSAIWREIVDAASAPYRQAGRFAWHHARGKLRWDPVFRHLLAAGLIAPRARVLDLGCGPALLASLVGAAGRSARRGRWPQGWAEAPIDARVGGIEIHARDVARARAALGAEHAVVCADVRTTPFAAADIVVILDVLHYLSSGEQDDVLARARAALGVGGHLVLRVGDAESRAGFAASRWVDGLVTLLRGQRVGRHAGRSLAAWSERLAALGFAVASKPMGHGTPFPNVLLVATVARATTPEARTHAAACA